MTNLILKQMKYFLYILLSVAIIMIGINATQLDFENISSKDSQVAIIAILAAACVAVLVTILLISRTIARKHRDLNE